MMSDDLNRPPDLLPLDYRHPERSALRGGSWVRRLVSVIVILGVMALLTSLLLPSTGRARPAAKIIMCTSNLRQIGQALALYTADHRGVYPPTLADILEYDVTPEIFVCPNSNEDRAPMGSTTQQTIAAVQSNPKHMSYVYVAANKPATSLPAAAVLVYEPPSNHPVDRTGYKAGWNTVDGGNVLFGDGHVAFVPTKVLKQMIKELNAEQNPPPATSGY
jgi:prepilin-type processing-associated H-X9-DG protein